MHNMQKKTCTLHNMENICKTVARNKPKNMHNIQNKHNMQKCAQYAKNMKNICKWLNQYAVPAICKHAKNMPKICQKCAINANHGTCMQNMHV